MSSNLNTKITLDCDDEDVYIDFQLDLNGVEVIFRTMGSRSEIPLFLEGKFSLEYDGTCNGIYCLLKLTETTLNFTVNEKTGGKPRVEISLPRDLKEIVDFLRDLTDFALSETIKIR